MLPDMKVQREMKWKQDELSPFISIDSPLSSSPSGEDGQFPGLSFQEIVFDNCDICLSWSLFPSYCQSLSSIGSYAKLNFCLMLIDFPWKLLIWVDICTSNAYPALMFHNRLLTFALMHVTWSFSSNPLATPCSANFVSIVVEPIASWEHFNLYGQSIWERY